MQALYTPKQVAKAIGVSESSLKRWCDRGLIKMEKTVGGHRRLPVSEVLRFLRESGHSVVDPEIIGLPSISGQGERVIERSRSNFRQALLEGKEEVARRVIYDLFLSKISLRTIIDDVLVGAFIEIGESWECGHVDVFEERRGCQIAQRILYELGSSMPSLRPNAPTAIGATGPGDQYSLATTCVELVLRDLGWQATSLGSNLPFASMHAAIRKIKPKLFWLSVSFIENETEFVTGFNQLYQIASEQGAAVLLGGRAISGDLRQKLRYSCYADNMQHLEAFAKTQYVMPVDIGYEFDETE